MAWWRRAASSAAIALSRTLPSRGARLAAAASASAGATAAAVCATTAASEDSARSRAPQLGFAAVALAEADAAPVSGGVPPLGANFIADVADAVGPACVSITTAPGGAEGGTLFGLPLLASSGSGVIIDGAGGVVVTNAHVVGGARAAGHAVQVALRDGRTFQGRVVACDGPTDLAVVRLELSPAELSDNHLPSARFGASSALRVGEWVVALGCPLMLKWSCSAGIVSALERSASELGLHGGRTAYIQTDAAINQGNSGGPLVNLKGEVVGINALKAAHADGVSFAIPSDTARAVVGQLLDRGRVARPYAGLRMFDLTPAVVQQLRARDRNFPRSVERGVIVPGVAPGSPAERAGVRPGDVVVEFDGKAVTSSEQIIDRLGYRVHEAFALTVVRRGDVKVALTLLTEESGGDGGDSGGAPRGGWRRRRGGG